MFTKIYEKTKNYIKENFISLLIIVIAIILVTVRLPYYISAPGGTIDTKEKVDIATDFKLSGSLNMAYVSQVEGTIPMLLYALINPNWDIAKEEEVTVGDETIEDEEYRNKMLLEEANDIAVLVAYDHSDIDYKTGKWNKKSECYTDRKALQLIWVYGGLSAWQGGCVSSTEFCVSLK